MRAIFAKYAVS